MSTKLSSSARTSEAGDVAQRLAVLFKKTDKLQEDKFLLATMGEISSMGGKITEAVRSDSVLSQLDELDLLRDNSLRVLGKLVAAYEVIPVDKIRNHGVKLAAVFNKYGTKITQTNYSEESNLIDSLLLDLSAKALEESIQNLPGVAEAIERIRSEQAKFASFRSEYEHALSTKAATVNASSLRKSLVNLINGKLIKYLDAMCVVSPEQYKNFTDDCSKIIESVNTAVKTRSKKGKKDEPEIKN